MEKGDANKGENGAGAAIKMMHYRNCNPKKLMGLAGAANCNRLHKSTAEMPKKKPAQKCICHPPPLTSSCYTRPVACAAACLAVPPQDAVMV